MLKANPYRPGAGLMPLYLAGRENDIQEMEQIFDALKMNIPVQSIMYTGLRGVGKTVLLNKLQKVAEEKEIFCRHIEVESKNDFISQMANASQAFLREASAKEKVKGLIKKAIDAIKSLVISFDPNANTFSLSLQERELFQSNNLTQSMTDVFTMIGKVAYELENPICFFVDEIQYMKLEELSSLIAALHRANQLGYPIMVVGAGLPKVYKMTTDVKTYSERLFIFKNVDSLTHEQAIKAIKEPVKELGISYTDDAVEKIIDITEGYPFFIQQFCQLIYKKNNDEIISIKDVEDATASFFEVLDSSFFKARYERCSDNDKKFIFAMVDCGELPCTIANVARNLNKSVTSISTIRAQLISKGIIFATKHGELDFTVPKFDEFIKRQEEYKQEK